MCLMQRESTYILYFKNDNGVMLCAGYNPMHSYGDAITMCHEVDKDRKKLVYYYIERDEIPNDMAFLAGECCLTS